MRRGLILVLLVGCGAKPGASTIGNHATRGKGDAARIDANDPRRDCPPGALEALAGGWGDPEEHGEPQLNACLRGNLIGDSVVVYASAPWEADSQREDGYPARRVIFGVDGKLLAEGEPDGGDYMRDPATLQALADLDGDGVDEVIEQAWDTPMTQQGAVLRLDGGKLATVGTFPLGNEECDATWEVDAVHQTIVVTVRSAEPTESCDARNVFVMQDGQLVQSWTDL